MDNNKKDWTPAERARFERIYCALISNPNIKGHMSIYIKFTEAAIEILDEHYKNTSHEPTT
jgi:hypothetical protein